MNQQVRKSILCTLLALVGYSSAQAQRIHIEEIGLRGYYSTSTPTRIRLHVDPPAASAHPLLIRIKVGKKTRYPTREDIFTAKLDLPGPQELELPFFIYTANNYEHEYVKADLLYEDEKQVIASDTAELGHNGANTLIAILCNGSSINDNAICNETQSQALFGGTEEERDKKNQNFKFVLLKGTESPDAWWGYGSVDTVILAAPIASLSELQRSALEQYLRQGSTLIVLEKEIADDNFLSSYRKGDSSAGAIVVGAGKLLLVPSLGSKKLEDAFSRANLKHVLGERPYWSVSQPPDEGLTWGISYWAQHLWATHFTFPRLLWVLIWLGVYTIIVGFVNFAILRRMRRREWAWVTTPLLALLFAAGLYAGSDFKRPRNFSVDEVVLQWMDEQSPLAASQTQLRISSPQVQETTLIAPGPAILMPPSSGQRPQAIINMENHEDWEPGWEIRIGAQQGIYLPLLRWDFRDLDFRDFVQLPGTIHSDKPGYIKNETGRSFDDAIYVDQNSKIFLLGAVAAGSEVNTASAPSTTYSDFCKCKPDSDVKEEHAFGPHSLEEVVSHALGRNDKEYFIGLSREKPTWEPELEGITPDRNRFVITIVALGRPHD